MARDPARATGCVLTVADDGVGMPPGSEVRIFDRFYRADPSRSGAGAGLGLAIAAWIVREHGGDDRGGQQRPRRRDVLGRAAGRPEVGRSSQLLSALISASAS